MYMLRCMHAHIFTLKKTQQRDNKVIPNEMPMVYADRIAKRISQRRQ